MLDDPRFATFEARQANLKAGLELVGEAMRTKATAEWIDIMNKAGVVVQAVRTLGEATSDPQLEHRGILVKAENVHGFDEALRLVGAPFIANEDSPMKVAAPPGKVGQHTEEVLRGLGYDDSEIAKILALNEG